MAKQSMGQGPQYPPGGNPASHYAPRKFSCQDFPEHDPPAIDAQFTLKEKQPRTRIGELEEKRDRSKKFFLNSDMTITAEIYPYSIHYDNSGSWEEIDNTIVADESVPELPLRNKANDFIFRLARNFTGSNKLVSVRQGQHTVFITPLEASRAEAEIDGNRVLYRNLYPSVDFEYFSDNDYLKENLIIHSYTGLNVFRYQVQAPQLTPFLNDGEVIFKDSAGNEIFVFTAPWMHDQNWQMSWDIQVTIEERPGPFFIVAYTLSDQWLRAPERVYPVIMDPQVRSSQVSYDINDSFVSSRYPSSNYVYGSMLKVGTETTWGMTRSYIKFPELTTKTPISSADEIVQAELLLRHDTSMGSDTVQVNVHKVTEHWVNTAITWNNQPAYDPRVYDFETFKSPGRWRTFDVTPIVKECTAWGQAPFTVSC